MAPMDAIPNLPVSSAPQTPPSRPNLRPHKRELDTEQVQLFTDLLKAVQAIQSTPAAAGADQPATTSSQSEKPRERASRLQFKSVLERWDSKAYKYKVEESPPDEDISELDQYIFVERIRIDKDSQSRTYFLDIKSKSLRGTLREVLRNVRVANLRDERPSVSRDVLFHFLPDIIARRDQDDVSVPNTNFSPQHLALLIGYLQQAYETTIAQLHPLLKHGEIIYELLWTLFKPNEIVYTTCFGTHMNRGVVFDCGEEKEDNFKRKYYSLSCRYQDYNGVVFGETTVELRISRFAGSRRIETLTAFPFAYHPRRLAVEAELVECGQKFVKLMGTHHCHCKGSGFYMTKDGPFQVRIDSRIMVDGAFFREMNPNYSRPKIDTAGEIRPDPPQECVDLFDGTVTTKVSPHDQITESSLDPSAMTKDELLVCCPTVLAFDFKNKLWLECAVAGITNIIWTQQPFDGLALPSEQKDIVMAIAEARVAAKPDKQFDDIIEGKGQGVITVLHGPPGVGKTLTAEAVAEKLRRPLYSISASELGVQPDVLEERLSRIFRLAHKWRAVLLLDEADVYLERRVTQDVLRNSLVSVFLRRLEHYKGIFFLTTNRVGDFDEAVCSRIHLFLKYHNLEEWARRKVWKTFLQGAITVAGPATVSPSELSSLITVASNGRQIKNLVSLAHSLATVGKVSVGFSHLKTVMKANGLRVPGHDESNITTVDDNSLYD